MKESKFRAILSKKLIVYPLIVFFLMTITLAFIPHYSCACGEIKKEDGSMLHHFVIKTVKDIAVDIGRFLN